MIDPFLPSSVFSYRAIHAITVKSLAKSRGGLLKKLEHEDYSDVLIECRDVYKSYGGKHILKGVAFKVEHLGHKKKLGVAS
ncbi:hypothetical protein HA466_0179080 [Hirschfeldia incana]|nr:hypothetical protein HA466_0179080 [Hirschfeldia incana]